MKNQSKSIAVTLLIAGISFCSVKLSMAQEKVVSPNGQAQSKNVTEYKGRIVNQQTDVKAHRSPHERNTELINKFLKTSDKKAAFEFLGLIKNGLTEELAATKRQILEAHEANDAKAADKAMQYNQQLANTYNMVVQKSRSLDSFDKDAIDQAFSKYLELKP